MALTRTGRFILWNPSAYTAQVPYRIVVAPNSCVCYSYLAVNDTNTPVSVPCNCEDLYLPVCRYYFTDRPQHDGEVNYSPQTIALLNQGQGGIPWRGEFAQCQCEVRFIL